MAVPALPAQAEAKPRTTVVMVVLDELPTHSLLNRRGRIDAVRFPNFARLARDSTWYSNATTVSDASKYAIPAILDGRSPKPGRKATFRGHPRNLFTLLRAQGYRLSAHEEATSLCPYPGCRRRFDARFFLSRERVERFQHFIASIGPSSRPTLHFKHTLLPHVPWVFLPSLRRYNRTVRGPIPGLNSSERSVFDRALVRQSWQRHLLQVEATDTLIGQLLDRLHETGMFDRVMLVVVADHGISFRVGATDRRTIVPANVRDIAPVPLFIKKPRQRRGRIDRSLVRVYDILPTIARTIGLRVAGRLAGRSAGSGAIRGRRELTVLSRAAIGRIRFSGGVLRRLKRQALRRKTALFGDGHRSLFDFGPNRRILLRRVDSLRVIDGGRLGARLNDPGEWRDVNPSGAFVPTHLTGYITGGKSGARRDVAVALNGYIRGVGRSAYLRGGRRELFSVLVAESALVRGPNPVEVFSVGRRGRRTVLRRLYGRPFSPP